MGAVRALLGFGIGILGFGFYWQLQNDILQRYLLGYVIQNEYYDLSNLFWNGMPIVCILVGIAALIMAGVLRRGSRVVHYE
jgi:hypothetical protein